MRARAKRAAEAVSKEEGDYICWMVIKVLEKIQYGNL